MSGRLGEILIKESLITSDQLKQALEHQKKNGGRLGTALMKLGFVRDDEITQVLIPPVWSAFHQSEVLRS